MENRYTVTITNDKGKVTTVHVPTYRAVKDMWKEPLRMGYKVTAQRNVEAEQAAREERRAARTAPKPQEAAGKGNSRTADAKKKAKKAAA